MIKYFQNRFILSEKGAKDLQKGIALWLSFIKTEYSLY